MKTRLTPAATPVIIPVRNTSQSCCHRVSTPLAARVIGSPPRAAVIDVASPLAAVVCVGPYSSQCLDEPNLSLLEQSHLAWCRTRTQGLTICAWCETRPQGPPSSLEDPCPVFLEVITRLPSSSVRIAVAVDVFVVPFGTRYYCIIRYAKCVRNTIKDSCVSCFYFREQSFICV